MNITQSSRAEEHKWTAMTHTWDTKLLINDELWNEGLAVRALNTNIKLLRTSWKELLPENINSSITRETFSNTCGPTFWAGFIKDPSSSNASEDCRVRVAHATWWRGTPAEDACSSRWQTIASVKHPNGYFKDLGGFQYLHTEIWCHRLSQWTDIYS